MSEKTAGPDTAMLLCAGRGTRMRELTRDRPKPLIPLLGKPLLARSLKKLRKAGIRKCVINIHAHAERMRAFIRDYDRKKPEIEISDESGDLLDTGGGVTKALDALGPGPFFVINCDIFWRNGPANTLTRMAGAWDSKTMDALLLMVPTNEAVGHEGAGDFEMDGLGRLTRRAEKTVAPWIFGGIQILHPRLFDDAPAGAFSLNRLYDRALESGRLYGLRHDGEWYHVGTPEALAESERVLRARKD